MIAMCSFGTLIAQNEKEEPIIQNKDNSYVIKLANGIEFVGKIISQDERELYIEREDGERILIPHYQITSITDLDKKAVRRIANKGNDFLPHAYFFSSAAFPNYPEDNYYKLRVSGPTFVLGSKSGITTTITTTWLGAPIIVSAKKSFKLSSDVHLSVAGNFATASWTNFSTIAAFPSMGLTFGDRKKNFSLSVGAGGLFNDGSHVGLLNLSAAGLLPISERVSLIFEAQAIMELDEINIVGDGFLGANPLIVTPGVRLKTRKGGYIQFGLATTNVGNEFMFPLPTVNWMRRF